MSITLNGSTGITTPGLTNDGSQTITGGTANGVAYLNGSKVLTTGSALTFDGSVLGLTTNQRFVASSSSISFWKDGTPTKAARIGYTVGSAPADSISLGVFNGSSWNDALIVDQSGRLGLGVTPSASWAAGRAVMQIGLGMSVDCNSPSQALVSANRVYTGSQDIYLNSAPASVYQQLGGAHQWFTAPSGTAGAAITSFTQAATLTANGDFLVGTTTTTNSARFACNNTANTRKWGFGTVGSSTPFYVIDDTSGSGVQLTAGATSWSSFSDERNKTEIKPFENAVEKICSLRTGTGRYLTDEESVSRSFLIAQDVQKVLPEAVDVTENEQGTLVLRYTDLIPLLTAAIQEQQAMIVEMKTKLDALESK